MDLKYVHFDKARNTLKRAGVCKTQKSAVGKGLGNILEDLEEENLEEEEEG